MKKLLLLIVFIPTILLGQKTEDESKALNLHNQARIAVGVVPLEWSNNLEKQGLARCAYTTLLLKCDTWSNIITRQPASTSGCTRRL